MIRRVRLVNFLAHRDTTVNLSPGVNVLVGPNGSGKSSVIDALTYALFGEHTRGVNANIVRRGSLGGWVEVEFDASGRRFVVVREFGGRGELRSTRLIEIVNGGRRLLASGEGRRGASVRETSRRILGVDAERLVDACVIRQGELSRIIEYEPREFRDLVFRVTGLEKLTTAYERALELRRAFVDVVKKRLGYDPNDFEQLRERLEDLRAERRRVEQEYRGLVARYKALVDEADRVKAELERLEEKNREYEKLIEYERSLKAYLDSKRIELKRRVAEIERKLRVSRQALESLRAGDVGEEIKRLNERIRMLEAERERLGREKGRLDGLLECGERLRGEYITCPSCGTRIDISGVGGVNPDAVKKHREEVLNEVRRVDKELAEARSLLKELERRRGQTDFAKRVLNEYGVVGEDDIRRMEDEAREHLKTLSKLSSGAEVALDEYSKSLFDKIKTLRERLGGFSPGEYYTTKRALEKLVGEQERLGRELGRLEERLRLLVDEIKRLEEVLPRLSKAYSILRDLDAFRERVYKVDSPVSKSLREWVLRDISERASRMLEAFQLRVQRVELSETGQQRGVKMTCFHESGPIDVRALSGGEKTALAISIRLAIASLIASNVDFLFLDEPTTHLDRERRAGFVRMMLNALRAGLGHVTQLVVITHDLEVFEGVEVDNMLLFRPSAWGVHVEELEPGQTTS